MLTAAWHSSIYTNHDKFIFHIPNQGLRRMSTVAQKVTEIIVTKLGVEESEVTPAASFTNDLGADSLDTVELIMEFERAFNMQISDDDAAKIQSVGDAISYIESKAS